MGSQLGGFSLIGAGLGLSLEGGGWWSKV